MGSSNLRFIAFRSEPDVAALKSATWIEAFRLFRQEDEPRWFLEGPSFETGSVTFYESLLINGTKARGAAAAVRPEIDRLIAALEAASGHGATLDDEVLSHALMISKLVPMPALAAFGNDEGLDGAIVCSDGRLAGGRLQAGEEKAVAIGADGSFSVVPLRAEGEDPEAGRPFYEIVTEEAGRFFGLAGPLPISSDPSDHDMTAYRLVASAGEAIDTRPPESKLEREIWAISSSDLSPTRKIAKYVAIMDPYVSAALRKDLINAKRKARDPLERLVWACRISDYAAGVEKTPQQIAVLKTYVTDLANYLVALRPSLEYRRAANFVKINDELMMRWRLLKLRLAIGSIFGR